MRAALLIAVKDLRRSMRDRTAIAYALVAPLTLAFILGTVIPDEELDVTYGVVNEDRGPVAQRFIDGLLPDLEADGFAVTEPLESRAVAERRAEADEIGAAFIFPAGFSEAVQAGRPARIDVVANPISDVEAPIARSIAEGYAAELNAVGLSIATAASQAGGPPSPELVARVRRAANAVGSPASVAEQSAGSREFDDQTFFPAGMAVFFLFLTTQLAAASLLRERREGTLTRLLAAPTSRASIVAGKALFTFVLGVVSLTVLIVATAVLLNAEWGNLIGVALMVVCAVFAAMGLQSLVATLAKTDDQAQGYGSIIAVTLGLLGGTFFPLSQAPGLVANLSYATPHAWIMRGLGDLSGGAGTVADIAPSLLVLLAFGTVLGGIALVRARNLVVAG